MKILNSRIRKFILLVLCSIGCSMNVSAQLGLPSVFTDGMVLQRNAEVAVWGWASPGDSVFVVPSWTAGEKIGVMANDLGKWRVKVKTTDAGGPFDMRIFTRSESIVLNDVLLGEVWLCSGQSNMEWSANMWILDKEKEVANADCKSLRIFHVPKRGAYYPQEDCDAAWEVASPESMRKTSATAYFYAKYLTQKLSVPVGIIVSAWGGSPIEVWMPKEVVKDITGSEEVELPRNQWWPVDLGVLFNQMINPIVPYTIRGCIWYQGETNCDNAEDYSARMKGLIDSWRNSFGNQFPFLYVQIAPYLYNSKNNGPAIVRQEQEKVLDMVENTAMINIADLVKNVADIHPRNKRAIGERLAFMAMDKVYGEKVAPYESPRFSSVSVEKDAVVLNFSGDFERIENDGKSIVGLVVLDEQGKQLSPKIKIENSKIRISTKRIESPFVVKYCFDDATIGSLRTEKGMPFLPFCTELINSEL